MKNIQPDSNSLFKRVGLHILFWFCFVNFFGLLWGSYKGEYAREYFVLLLELPIRVLIVYFNLYILLPRYLLSRQYVAYSFALTGAMLIAGTVQYFLVYSIYYPIYAPEFLAEGYFSIYKFVKYAIGLNTVILITTIIKILKYWYKDQQTAQTLAREKLEAELKLLKGQIHPHFLFNTLNNLYSLTLKKSDCAPEIVLKLSELMNYMLYEAAQPQVTLEKEIQYIQNYIALEKIRYAERVEINFNIRGQIGGFQIAPLLLLPFVENSFKHGVSGEIERAWITIDLSVKDQLLIYKVENSKANFKVHSQRDYAQGIGLQNLRRRLELIYKDRHELKILDEEGTYLAILKITLDPLSLETKKVKSKEVVL
jgi:two-component system, LytTR family, sensor kinase